MNLPPAVTVSTPGKLMLFGEHAVVYGHPCIVTAVDQRMTTMIAPTDTMTIVLYAKGMQPYTYTVEVAALTGKSFPKNAQFVMFAVKNFFEKYRVKSGLKITTLSDFSASFGFGSSSAVTVGVIGALAKLFQQPLSQHEIFTLAYQTILDVQGVGSGFDIAAAVWGGTLFFQNKGEVVQQLNAESLPLLVGYTGIKADTVTLINQVKTFRAQNPSQVQAIFSEIEQLTINAMAAIENQAWTTVGDLMTQNEQLLAQLGVESDKLAELISAAHQAGALGAKLSGAGGGDSMLALYNEGGENELHQALQKVGEVMPVEINAEGLRYET